MGGMTTDISGNIYFSDSGTCAIRFINQQTGTITTIAGGYTSCGTGGDGSAAATSNRLSNPGGLSLDVSGNLLIADTSNNQIRLVTLSTRTITTFAGTGAFGSTGDGNAAVNALLNSPNGVISDHIGGKVYIADTYNIKIRMVNSAGTISTFAGGGTHYLGDGGAATDAIFMSPTAVALGPDGSLYIVDSGSNNIRKVTMMSDGANIITTVAGSLTGGYGGDGNAATSAMLQGPAGLAIDSYGNLYIADRGNNVVRFVAYDTAIITTFAGGPYNMYLGDGGSATSAYLLGPKTVTVDSTGTVVYIGDAGEYRIRKVVKTYNFPTSQPSSQPNAHPTSQPSSHPSLPTGQPSKQPTSEPSKYIWRPKQEVRLLYCLTLYTDYSTLS